MFLTIVNYHNMSEQADIRAAFLNDALGAEIHMVPLKDSDISAGNALTVRAPLYGIERSPRFPNKAHDERFRSHRSLRRLIRASPSNMASGKLPHAIDASRCANSLPATVSQ